VTPQRTPGQQQRRDDEEAATRTVRCLYCGAHPGVWCRGRSRYNNLPFVPHHPHTARMKTWRAQQQPAPASGAGDKEES
jgi:hypothetical protein